MSVDGIINLSGGFNDRRAIGLNPNVNIPVSPAYSASFSNGSGALQGDSVFQNVMTLVAGTLNVDLNASLVDSYGTSVTFVRIKAIMFKNTGTNNIVVGAGTTPWATLLSATGTLTMPPGAAFAFFTPDATGWAVTPATGDVLKFAGTGTDTFELTILGAKT